MAAFATAPDVEARWRPLSAAETTVATTLLEDASTLLRALVPTIDQQITDGDIDENLVVAAVVQAVLPVLRNPDAMESESIDDWTGRYADVDPRIGFSAGDLDPLTPTTTTAAFTITPYGAPPE